MNHRGGRTVERSSLWLREISDAESESKTAKRRFDGGAAWRWLLASSFRSYRWILPLALGLCVLTIRHYMVVIPRVLRRRRNRQTKLIVPFPIDGDEYLKKFSITVKPLQIDNLHGAKNGSVWEWYCYLSQNYSTAEGPRVLMAQYAGTDEHYSSLLQTSSLVNRAYAKQWGMDYVTLKGIGLDDHHVIPSEYFQPQHSAFNKLELLRRGLELSHRYDWLWVLDSDALVYNLSTSFSSILPANASESIFLVAHRVQPEDSLHTHNINNGVLLLNLHHPTTRHLLSSWTRHSLNRIAANVQLCNMGNEEAHEADDQVIMQSILQDLSDPTVIYTIPHFQNHVVKHLVRPNMAVWDNHSPGREVVLKDLAIDICKRYAPVCDGVNGEEPSRNTPCMA